MMVQFLRTKYQKVIVTKEYVIAEGSLPVCLVAHLDTVSENPPSEIFCDLKQQVMWSPDLLGADDRAGVYAIKQIINDGYLPSVILTTDEERGCLGAQALVHQIPSCPLENLKAILQLDRRGSQDCVFYDCDNPDFTEYISSFGFIEAIGSFSDISIIAPSWGVAAANLSVGYYNEHSKIEYLRFNELDATITKVCNILDNAEQMLAYAYIERPQVGSFYDPYKCAICGKKIVPDKYKIIKQGKDLFDICDKCCDMYMIV